MRVRATAAAAALLLALAGCSSDDGPRFEADDLSEGTCRDAGADLLAVDAAQRELASDDADPAAVADLAALQDRLLAARDGAPREVADELRGLVTAMGFVRVGVDAGTLGDEQLEQLRRALDDTLTACGVDPSG